MTELTMGLFKNISFEVFQAKLAAKKVPLQNMGHTFILISPHDHKYFKLKQNYKSREEALGLYSDYINELQKKPEVAALGQQKLAENDMDKGMYHITDDASLKLHLSLNNIGSMDEEIVMGLIDLLIEASQDPNSNLGLHFKITYPHAVELGRFKDNDQFTLYFDKYSSTAAVVRLANQIEEYLHKHDVIDNINPFGDKDVFGFNSFVSARYETNKLNHKYDMHEFFDLELEKFFKSHADLDQLEELPLCCFEVIFNNLIISKSIRNLRAGRDANPGLSRSDSSMVQREFEKMLNNPKDYISPPDIDMPALDRTFSTLRPIQLISTEQSQQVEDLSKRDPRIGELFQKLNTMKKYGEYLITIDMYKGNEVIELARDLEINAQNFILCALKKQPDYSEILDFVTDFKNLLHCQDELMEEHRAAWKPIVANIFLSLLVIPLIAIAIKATSHLINKEKITLNNTLFFAQTRSKTKIDEIETAFDSYADNLENSKALFVN